MDLRECLLLTQSGHGRLRIATVQTNPQPRFAERESLLNPTASSDRRSPTAATSLTFKFLCGVLLTDGTRFQK